MMYARSARQTVTLTLSCALLSLVIASGNTGCTGTGSASNASPSPGATTSTAPAATGATAFRDATKAAGINYKWTAPGKRPLNILQTIGNGGAFLDYDRDGNLDILLVGQPSALYKGDGKGQFTDVSAASGIGGLKGHFLGCAVGDYDNDGFSDIYLSAYRGGALLHNEGGKSFKDASTQVGIPQQPWGTSCAFGDINRDGYLDLYVGNYVIFGPDTDPQLCDNQGIKTSCGPRFYKPEKSRLYLGGPGFKFKEVTDQWKAQDVEGKALGVAFGDYDGNGKTHLAIANDEMPGDLLENKGSSFENIGKTSGTAYDDSGNVHGGMGVDWGDYNNDGKLDLAVGTFQNEAKNIYTNDGDGLFTDRSAMLGMAPATSLVTFGLKWLDYDNDGWLDVILANGHVQDNIAEIDKTASYRQPTQLFHSEEGKRFAEVSKTAIDASGQRPIVGRGLALGDYDNDGKIDVLLVDSEGEPILLHNETPDAGNALMLNLIGSKSNRDALGARVEVVVGGKTYVRQCVTDGSYMSASDKRVHVGIGKVTTAETVTVHWPSGKKTEVKEVPVNKPFDIKED